MRKPTALALLAPLLIAISAHASPAPSRPAPAQPILLDSVIATVDEKPITLLELGKRFTPARSLSLDVAAKDADAQAMLERMIFEEVIFAEAEIKKIAVDDQEIDRYLDEVARRNNLSHEGLLKALAEEKKDISLYRRQIRIDILQSRLGTSYLQGSSAVTEEEVNGYLQEHPELTQGGTQVQLERILVATQTRTEEEALARAEEALTRIKNGDPFSMVARELSDGPEAAEGGSFGLIAEKDLSEDIFDATMKLSKGDVSEIVKSELGFQIFKVSDRISSGESDNSKIAEEVKRRLAQGKQQSKLQSFFTTELFKNHTVEKKI